MLDYKLCVVLDDFELATPPSDFEPDPRTFATQVFITISIISSILQDEQAAWANLDARVKVHLYHAV